MMMWVQTSWSCNFLNLKPTKKHRPSSSTFVCLQFGTDVITEIANNKVIVAAAVSAAIGQISKPFTSVLLYGEKFEINIDTEGWRFPFCSFFCNVQGDMSHIYAPLKESVGHTPVEVLASAILGFVVSLIVYTL